MIQRSAAIAIVLLAWAAIDLLASGQAGIYGIVERVGFEPNERSPERIQVWGAFALIERMPAPVSGTSMTTVDGQFFTNWVYRQPTRGYLYFKLPPAIADAVNARREWADLAAVAGTRQAIAFGNWDRTRGDAMMTVRSGASRPADPDVYYTDVGIAKLAATGSHAGIVADLRKLLDR
jgi:hypothetical protein